MPKREIISAPPLYLPVEVAIEPVRNILSSLSLLLMSESRAGLDPWIEQVAAAMSPEQLEQDRLLLWGFMGALNLVQEQAGELLDFEQFLAALAAADPIALRDRALSETLHWLYEDHPELPRIELSEALADEPRFIEWIQLHKEETPFSEAAGAEALYRLMQEPATAQALLVESLRRAWEGLLRAEWDRRLPQVQAAAEAMRGLPLERMSLPELLRMLTGRELNAFLGTMLTPSIRRVLIIPSPHIGPYVSAEMSGDRLYLFVAARSPQGAELGQGQMSDFELNSRIEALADPLRLAILRRLAGGELSTAEIMEAFDLTKSTASRHLRLLVATGFILERREEGAKKVYTLDRAGIERGLGALHAALLGGAS